MHKALLVSLALLGALAAPALAQESDPAGAWEFRTDIREKGCTITGLMTIEPLVPGEELRQCEFISSEVCGEIDMEPVDMQQACAVRQDGEFLIIRSKVVASRTPGRGIAGYLPDHFTVRPSGPGRMSGTWHDRNFTDLVEFWRARSGAVS